MSNNQIYISDDDKGSIFEHGRQRLPQAFIQSNQNWLEGLMGIV